MYQPGAFFLIPLICFLDIRPLIGEDRFAKEEESMGLLCTFVMLENEFYEVRTKWIHRVS